MEPVAELTVIQLLTGVSKLAPLINGVWAVLSVLLGAVIVGAIWVTKISIAVKGNTEQLKGSDNKLDTSMCDIHRDACDKRHIVEFGTIGQSLVEIKEAINKINERHERYQEALLRNMQKGD